MNYSIKQRSISSIITLGGRQIVVQITNFIGSIFIARLLSVEDYGIYGLLNYLFLFLMNFGDIGLGASLINCKEEPNLEKKRAIFTLQLIIVGIVSAVFLVISPFLQVHYKLPQIYQIAFWLIASAFFANTFRVIPQAQLERHIDFKWVSITEIIQTILFNGAVVCFIVKGSGALGVCWAFLLRAIFGSAILMLASPWRIGLSFQFKCVAADLRFGIPFQLTQIVNLIKDSISPIIAGTMLGLTSTGIINMASLIATLPTVVLFIFARVYFPVFSRSQANLPQLKSAFISFVRLNNAVVAISACFIFAFMDAAIQFIWGDKWVIVKPLVFYLWSANLFLPAFIICQQYFNAQGKAKINFLFALCSAIFTLTVGSFLMSKIGIIGFGITNLIVNIAMFFIVLKTSRDLSANIIFEIGKSWFPAVLISGVAVFVHKFFAVDTLQKFIVSGCVYIGFVGVTYWLINKKEVTQLINLVKNG